MILVAVLAYFFIGLSIVLFIEANTNIKKKQTVKLYSFAFAVGCAFLFLYDFVLIDLISNFYHIIEYGVYSPDEFNFHLSGIERMNDLSLSSSEYAGWTILWQYIIAINYILFDVNTIYPKLFNVMCYSITAVSFFYLSMNIFGDYKLAQYSIRFYFLFFPLMYSISTIMREVFMTTLIILILLYVSEYFKNNSFSKFLFILFLISLLVLTRIEYGIIMMFSFVITFIIISKISIFKKVFYAFVLTVSLIFVSQLSIFQDTEIVDTITGEGGRSRYVHTKKGEAEKADGYASFVKIVFSNPISFIPIITYGSLNFFLDPLPFKFLNENLISNLNRQFFFSLFNSFFVFYLPIMFIGLYYLFKFKDFKPIDYVYLVFFILVYLGILLNMRDPTRYKMPIFPLIFFLTTYGLKYKLLWKKYYPYILLLMGVFALYFILFFDVKSLVI